MATYKELQDINKQRQTGQVPIEVVPPPKRTRNEEGNLVETPTSYENAISGRDLFGQINTSNLNYAEEAERAGYGESKYDTRSGFQPGANIEDLRAREQSWGSKVINGTLKGGLTIATTYANSTAGFAASIATALYGFTPFGQVQRNGIEALIPFSSKQDFPTIGEAIQAGTNNELSKRIVALQQLGEEWFPNYRTEYEQSEQYQRQWYRPRNLISGNTIGDMFLKNFGFTVGAMLGAGTWQKALGKKAASELAKDTMAGVAIASEGDAAAIEGMSKAAEAIKRGGVFANGKVIADNVKNAAWRSTAYPIVKQLEFGVISAMGEGNAEGLMARDEYLEGALADLEQWFNGEYAGLEERVLHSHPDNREEIYIPNESGEYDKSYILTEAGKEALLNRQNLLFDEYRKRREKIMQEADELAAVTFGLNIPILTVSNLAQFSKLLGGGWRSAREAAGKAYGRMTIDAAGRATANYVEKNVLRGIAKGLAGTAKAAGAEAIEEMSQGYVSSGAKAVADASLTSYNDYGYDRKSLDFFKNEWFEVMGQGGRDYLGDTKNWQEGFLGAVTGLVGMPGRGYFRGERGGVAEAISDARNEISASNSAAAKLNQLVNSGDFQDRWKGYIRHLAFDDQIKNAVNRDDEYLFHWADDGQLFNDVMTFAKAGRLDDLTSFADRFSNLSKEDIQDIREQLKTRNEPNVDRDAEIKQRVEKQAQKIKKTVEDYGRIREETLARLPMDASPEIVDEAVFTGMQIQAAEERFINLLNQTLDALDGALEAKSTNKKNSAEYKAELESLKSRYTKIFAGSLTPVDASTRENDEKELKKLDSLVSGNEELKKKVDDMKKLYRDRQNFFEKYTKLQKTTNEEFAAQAQNQQKVQAAAEKQAAKEESASLNSLAAVKAEYNKEKKRNISDAGAFVNRMRKIKDSNPNVAQFLDIYDAYDDLRNIYTRDNGTMDALTKDIIDNVFENAQNKSDLVNPNKVETYEQYSRRVRGMFDTRTNGASFEDMLNKYRPQMDVSEETYNEAYNRVVNSMRRLGGVQSSTSGRSRSKQAAEPEHPAPAAAQSNANEQSQDSSRGPNPNKKKSASVDADGKSAVDSEGRTWTVGETMYGYDPSKKNPPIQYTVVGFKSLPNGDVKMIANDGMHDKEFGLVNQTPFLHKEPPQVNSTPQQTADVRAESPTIDSIQSDAATLTTDDSDEVKEGERETNEDGDKLYYQMAIPEFDVEIAREWRMAKGVDAKKAVIRKIQPFYNPNDPKKAGFKTLWEKLNTTWDAYTNAVKHIEVGDKVKFIANADAGEYNGNPIIIMAVEKNGERYIFNVMRRTGKYAGLNEFLNEFDSKYRAFKAEHPGQEFVFDKESVVWGKRGGIIDYDYSDDYAGEKAITEISGYDENAPIVWINGNAEFETLRGDHKAVRNIDAFRNMSDAERRLRRGNIYYLADDGLGGYIPIALGIEHFTSENYRNDNPKFNAIRDSLMRIEGIAGNFFSRVSTAINEEEKNSILNEENERLHSEVAELRKLVNITNGFFGLTFNKQGQPVLFYDRNANASGQKENSKFNGFYLGENGENNISKLVQIFADENVSLDFYPKRNFRSMLDDGFLTSNAKRLLPKNVDVYIEHWNGSDFEPTELQRQQIEGDESPSEPVDNGPGGLFRSVPVAEGEYREDDTGFVFTADDFADEPVEQDTVSEEGKYSPWQSLTDEQRQGLEEYYDMTEKDFNEASPEDREELLSCIGV